MGQRRAVSRARRAAADPAQHRLCGMPLVSRDGTRIVRERGDGRTDERELRLHQGGSRRASGHRRDLHAGDPGDDGARRMADDGVPDTGRRAVLRGHVLPARGSTGHAQLSARAGWRGGRVGEQAGERDEDHRLHARPVRAEHGAHPRHGRARRGAALARDVVARTALRAAVRRLRWRAEISTHDDAGLPAAAVGPHGRSAGAGDGDAHVPIHGARWDLRPGGRRLLAVQRGRVLAGTALREDAVRQRAPRPARRQPLAGDARARVPARDGGDDRLARTRDDLARRWILFVARRRQRGARGPILRLGRQRTGHPARRGCRSRQDILGRDRRRQLRGAQHPVRAARCSRRRGRAARHTLRAAHGDRPGDAYPVRRPRAPRSAGA